MQDVLKEVDSNKVYPVAGTVALTKETNTAKFDAIIGVTYRSNVDPKKADQQVRGAIILPNRTGKTQTVLVFTKRDEAKEAEAAGADFVGDDDMIQEIQSGWFGSDVVVATPDMVATVGRLGRILGPRSLMPNPKTGTVTMDVTKAVNKVKAGKVTYRVDKAGNIHVPTGEVSFDDEKLIEDFAAIHNVLLKAKPSAVGGRYMKNIMITTTFGPGIHVDQVSF